MEYHVKYTDSARYKCLEYLKKQSVELYLAYCGEEICDPGHSYGPTQRQEYLLHYIIDGKGRFTVNNQTWELDKHKAFLIKPDETTYYEADKEDPWVYVWVAFYGTRAEECLKLAGFDKENRICHFENESTLIKCVDGMLESHQLTYANDLKRQSYLMLFLSTIIDETAQRENSLEPYEYPNQVYVNHAIDYIAHNYHKNIKISDIANYIGINRSYLTNSFKKNLNMSPKEYLSDYRITKASGLLKTTNLPINKICSMIGYEDPFAFSKVFKAKHGISPKAYRENENVLEISDKKEE